MKIETIKTERFIGKTFSANCYKVTVKTGDDDFVLIVDPCVSWEKTRGTGKDPIAVLLTHGHFDHFTELESYLGIKDIRVYLHPAALLKLSKPFRNCSLLVGKRKVVKSDSRFITVNDDFRLENGYLIECIKSPGHTDGSLSFKLGNALFTGDFLFRGSIGRTDLPGGSFKAMKASLQKLKERFHDENPDIYPGHGEETTFRKERETNPRLR